MTSEVESHVCLNVIFKMAQECCWAATVSLAVHVLCFTCKLPPRYLQPLIKSTTARELVVSKDILFNR